MKKIKTKQNRYLYILPKEANEKDHYMFYILESYCSNFLHLSLIETSSNFYQTQAKLLKVKI